MRMKMWLAGALAAVLLVAAGCGSKKADQAAAPVQPGSQQVQGSPAAQAGQPAQSNPAAQTNPPAPASQPVQGSPAAQTVSYAIVKAQSTTSYSVHEKFLQQNLPGVAVGKTSEVTGNLVLSGGAFASSTVTVDLRTLKSDKAQRDRVLHGEALETDKYQFAEFTVTGVEGAAPAFADGQAVPFKLAGKLKLHGVEKPVVWDAKATLSGGTITLDGTVQFKMQDFNITPPNRLNVIAVDDNVQLDVHLTAIKS